jgi:hypothetical protein
LRDDPIQRLQREALVSCLVMAVAAMAIARTWWAGVAVLGGGLLIATSFLSIRGGLEGLSGGGRVGRAALKITARYALLAFLAYVMIARLRLPPLGLIAGASSVVAAAALEAGRLLFSKGAAARRKQQHD